MSGLNSILDVFGLVAKTTLNQIIGVLGFFLVFGLILYYLAKFTRLTFAKTTGPTIDVVATGWLGTPVHELGHALFCIIFGHKIVEMKLYNPDPADGSLGYVNHQYNPRSTWAKVGNFFIGVGPIIFGSIVLYAALYYLLPQAVSIFASIQEQVTVLSQGAGAGWEALYVSARASTELTLSTIFNAQNFGNWKFWVFLYISICVASHMQLSPPDIKGALSGFITLVIALFVINFIMFLIGGDISALLGQGKNLVSNVSGKIQGAVNSSVLDKGFSVVDYVLGVNAYIGFFAALFVYASIISAFNFVLSYAVLSVYSLLRYRRIVNPFF